MASRNILLLVPHPDDEVVACCAALGRAQAEGATLFALYLSHGCLARETLWPWQRKNYERIVSHRRAEAETVAQFLKILPIGWSDRPARQLWQNLTQVHDEIDAAIKACHIAELWAPAYEGGNPDHDALNAVASLYRSHIPVREFAEYTFCNQKVHSNLFPFPNGQETTIILTTAEREQKRAALKLYQSEQNNLGYVGVSSECYRPLADYDYSKPPHDGTLWYARFQWVPFRHPRVDFTRPEDVSKAITAFLRAP